MIGFAGQFGCWTDNETSMNSTFGAPLRRFPWVWMGHREYDPTACRFLTRDPIGYDGGINLYAYANNNPIMFADPSGLDWFDNVSDFFAGSGDSLTFGLTGGVRRLINKGWTGSWDDLADDKSGYYTAGEWTETGFEIALTLGSAGLKKMAAKKADSIARAEASREFRKLFGKESEDYIKHHVNPLKGHPGGSPTTFPTRGLPGKIHTSPANIKLYPKDAAGKAAHLAAHNKLKALEKVHRAVVNPTTTALRAGRNLMHDRSK